MWEKEIDIYQVREIRARTTVFLGVGAIKKIDDICADLKARGLTKLIVVTGRGAYKKNGRVGPCGGGVPKARHFLRALR